MITKLNHSNISYSLDSEPFERNWTARIISYFDDYETFERDWSARNNSYTDDFETDKNLSHKEKFLFYGPYCSDIDNIAYSMSQTVCGILYHIVLNDINFYIIRFCRKNEPWSDCKVHSVY